MFKVSSIKSIVVMTSFVLFASFASATTSYELASGERISDPTKPANWRVAPAGKKAKTVFKLNYILNAKERKQAIVNGKKVTEGDLISGARVISIKENEVVLSVNGSRQILRVNKKRKDIKSTK